MFCWTPSWAQRAFAKCDVKRGSQSVIILVRIPNHRYTFFKYKEAIPLPEMRVLQGRKTAAREQPWSTMVRIALCLVLSGSWVMRSIITTWNGSVSVGTGMRYSGVLRGWLMGFDC